MIGIAFVLVFLQNGTPELIGFQLGLALRLADALCQQKRFAEAESLVREEELVSGLEPRSRLSLEKQLGEVLARAGKPKEVGSNEEAWAENGRSDIAYVGIDSPQ